MEPVKVPPSSEYGVRNPFRLIILHKQFDAAVFAYMTKHRNLFGPNGTRPGNAWSQAFWRGFDGVPRPKRDDLKDTPAYACWRAGVMVRAKDI